ncbi:outer membrane protein assembly factor [Rubrivivax gelatinosus]|uniref:autotransporter assembly complex protein TamA n=1 Tax=Rubrivivax gelatinosus TaxID=28068 RepID=UPI0019042929|nr:BamA/TamA family outer membrane protein [Rubrivivax gelatinosus]MBK1616579.1 outer membrane protein assembly factor [Rubrivivax gelatinosus]
MKRVLTGLAVALAAGAALAAGTPDAAPAAEAAASAAEAPAAPPASVEVDAPPALKALLEQHLDITRVATLAPGSTLDDSEWARLIDGAPAQVRELLETEGYFDPTVILVRSVGNVGERHVRLELQPGPRTRVAKVTIEVEGALADAADGGQAHAREALADLRHHWALPAGQAFRNPDWNAAKSAALARLRAAGYAGASWKATAAEVDTAAHAVQLVLVADSGPLFRFGEIVVDGLVVHDTRTVENLAGFAAGAPLTESALLDYQERLQQAGLFDSAAVTLEPDTARADHARVLVHVKEAPLQVYTFGIGVSANTGPRASLEHAYRRVFGYALSASNTFSLAQKKQTWAGEISTHPGEDFYRDLIGGTVDREEGSEDIVLSQQLRLGRSMDTQQLERLYYLQAERSARTTTTHDSVHTNTIAYSINHHNVWRRLDSVVLPTEGYSLSLQASLGHAHGSAGDTGPFSRLYGRFTGYLPIGRAWYGSARLELGQVVKRDAVAVPDSQLFRAGGDDSVRGYSYRSLTPTVNGAESGGTSLLTASLELARPISASMPSVWGAVFVDAGRAANGFSGFNPAIGSGVGVRWRSPVGPLKLDLAYGQETQQVRVHFSVGIAY